MTSVQFRTIPDVLDAIRTTDVVNWSIWYGKQLLPFKYTGKDETESINLLERTLSTLQSSAAIYTVKMYDEMKYNSAGHCKITKATEECASFNFRLNDETYGSPYSMQNKELERKLAAMQLKVEQLEAEKEAGEDEEDDSIMGVLNGMVKENIPMLVPILMGKLFGGQPGPATALAGIPENDGADLQQEKTDPVQVIEAIKLMRAVDPGIDKHLIRLGELAKSNPKKFKSLIGMMKFL